MGRCLALKLKAVNHMEVARRCECMEWEACQWDCET